MRSWILCGALSLTACASSHPGDVGLDASGDSIDASADGGTMDAPHPCGERAGHPICGAGCAAECPGGEEVMACVEELGVCVYRGGCTFQDADGFEPPDAIFCQDGSACEASWVGSYLRGTCYSIELCIEESLDCIYYDRTPVVDGPALDEVPCPVDSSADFCGPGCGFERCPDSPEGASPFDRTSCIGVNEERAIGVCAYATQSVCTPDFRDDYCMVYFDEPCACLVDRGTSPPEWGWLTRQSDCLAYRALYPDDFHCLDTTWSEIE
jgi:hypothetical protein